MSTTPHGTMDPRCFCRPACADRAECVGGCANYRTVTQASAAQIKSRVAQ